MFVNSFYLKIFSILLLCCFSIENFANPFIAQQNNNGKEKLNAGTEVIVGIKDNWTDNKFRICPAFFVLSDVQDKSGNTLIAKNTQVVTECSITKPRGLGKPGSVAIRFISTTAVDGTMIALDGKVFVAGEDRLGLVLGLGIGLGFFTFGWGLFFLCLKGGKPQLDDYFSRSISTAGISFITPQINN